MVAAAGSSCLIQPLSTVMNAVDRLGDLAGRSVAVVGLGSIGLFSAGCSNSVAPSELWGLTRWLPLPLGRDAWD